MGEPAILEPPETDEAVAAEVDEQPEEVPSVFSVTTRHMIGAADVSPVAEDGSRVLRLFSGNGAVVIEANLAPRLCDFLGEKFTEVEVIAEGDEDAPAGE